MAKDLPEPISGYEVVKRFIKSIDKGLLKVMSKMGISTYQSYCGAQIFDAVGLSRAFVDEFFFGTATTIEGAGLAEIAAGDRSAGTRTRSAIRRCLRSALEVGGEYAYRLRGEAHSWTPETVSLLQHAARGNAARQVRRLRQAAQRAERAAADDPRPVPHQARPRRTAARPCRSTRSSPPFRSSSASRPARCRIGSISREAHTTLAIAMNRIGGKSNTGEGGEESDRYKRLPNGNSMRSAIKQVASGPLRRDGGISRQFRHDADQDGAGREARRRRPIARPQGRRGDRQGAPFDAGRRPHLAAAASRHLFDRGPEAARLRPQERQSRRRWSRSSSSPKSASARSRRASPSARPTT